MIRRIALAAALAIGVTAVGVGASSASAAAPIGPECGDAVRNAVLAAVQGRVMPGQVIQYLQFVVKNGQLAVQSCVVTVPA